MKEEIQIYFMDSILVSLYERIINMNSITSKLLNKYSIYSFVFIIIAFPLACNIMDIDTIPTVTERGTKYKIIVKDNTDYMEKLFGNDLVRNAEIMIKSNMQGIEYRLTTDSNGVAEISGIISDDYLITVNRWMLPDEMKIITGISTDNIKLTNTNKRIIRLSPNTGTEVIIPLKMAVGNSPIVISEIYACGPPGSGLYYHDKYVEVYNQSDSVRYLDGLLVAVVYVNSYLGIQYRDDTNYVHSTSIWKFPGSGKEFPIQPGQFVVCAEDAIDHRVNAPNSVDLSHADFEFYKDDAPDVDNPNVPNMLKIYQASGNDWLIGGESGSIIISNCPSDLIEPWGDQYLIPMISILDGVEYMKDPTRLDKKICSPLLDAGATGSIQFYTGKSMERKTSSTSPRRILKDDNNSSVDFDIIEKPTPDKYH
jgi:hypothetical protein